MQLLTQPDWWREDVGFLRPLHLLRLTEEEEEERRNGWMMRRERGRLNLKVTTTNRKLKV